MKKLETVSVDTIVEFEARKATIVDKLVSLKITGSFNGKVIINLSEENLIYLLTELKNKKIC